MSLLDADRGPWTERAPEHGPVCAHGLMQYVRRAGDDAQTLTRFSVHSSFSMRSPSTARPSARSGSCGTTATCGCRMSGTRRRVRSRCVAQGHCHWIGNTPLPEFDTVFDMPSFQIAHPRACATSPAQGGLSHWSDQQRQDARSTGAAEERWPRYVDVPPTLPCDLHPTPTPPTPSLAPPTRPPLSLARLHPPASRPARLHPARHARHSVQARPWRVRCLTLTLHSMRRVG